MTPAGPVLSYAYFKDHLHHFPIVLRTLYCKIRIHHLILMKNSLFSRRSGHCWRANSREQCLVILLLGISWLSIVLGVKGLIILNFNVFQIRQNLCSLFYPNFIEYANNNTLQNWKQISFKEVQITSNTGRFNWTKSSYFSFNFSTEYSYFFPIFYHYPRLVILFSITVKK